MDDAELRAHLSELAVPEFPDPAWVTPRPLAESTVGIVTTAGLHRSDDARFSRGDASFRTVPRDARDLVLGHWSPNFDRAAFASDLNIVAPLDRLEELSADGAIGAVAPRHVSFVGSQPDELTNVRFDTGPQAAAVLRDDGVDTVLIIPVGPMCTRTVCVLAHVLEAHGIATVALVSIERLAQRMHPPRALFCEFPLGRPLGRPDDPEYQHGVLRQALGLLAEPAGPVLRTWPDAFGLTSERFVCSLGDPADASTSGAVAETRGLRAAYDAYRRSRGRTSVGHGVGVEHVDEIAAAFDRIARGTPWKQAGLPAHPVACAIDLRTYYEEAALALVDLDAISHPGPGAVEAWFYRDTIAGGTLLAARETMRDTGAPFSIWYYLVGTLD